MLVNVKKTIDGVSQVNLISVNSVAKNSCAI